MRVSEESKGGDSWEKNRTKVEKLWGEVMWKMSLMREERNARGRRCARMYAREKGKAWGRRQSAEYLASFFRSLQLSSPPYLLLTAHKTLFVSSSQTMKKRKKTRGKCAPTREVILLFGKKISKIIITFTPSLEGELQISPMNNESVALLFFFPVLMCQSVNRIPLFGC